MKIKTPDGFTLDAVFNEVPHSSKGVVFAHGMTVDKDDEGIFVRAEPRLNKLGLSTLRFDFRAHGKSSGNSITDFTISGELKDLDAIISFMEGQGLKWIGLAGASFGGGIAALYASQNPSTIQALLLANPAVDFEKGFLNPTTRWAMKHFANLYSRIKHKGFIEVASRKFKMGKKLFDEMKLCNPCKALQTYTGKLLIIHGDKDTKVAYRDVVECYEKLNNSNKRLEIIKGSEHGFHEEPYETQVVEKIIDFFTK
ncbi:MAG: alpha/beta fold hydrolase [bacterium]|nr:alpha/beta fold hydrolase [bacterium]